MARLQSGPTLSICWLDLLVLLIVLLVAAALGWYFQKPWFTVVLLVLGFVLVLGNKARPFWEALRSLKRLLLPGPSHPWANLFYALGLITLLLLSLSKGPLHQGAQTLAREFGYVAAEKAPGEINAPATPRMQSNASQALPQIFVRDLFILVGALIALIFSWWRHHQAEVSNRLGSDRLVAENFREAVQMLTAFLDEEVSDTNSSTNSEDGAKAAIKPVKKVAMEARLGALEVLYQIACQELRERQQLGTQGRDEHYRPAVLRILVAYVRTNAQQTKNPVLKETGDFHSLGPDVRRAFEIIHTLVYKEPVINDGLDFSHVDFHGLDLRDAFGISPALPLDLSEAQLQNTVLSEVYLQGANLSKALLQGANLFAAHLENAEFFCAKLQGACLAGADLTGARLNMAQLQNDDLELAVLFQANLVGAQLQGAKLDYASLQGSLLSFTNLQSASFAETQLQGALLNGANLQGAAFTMANLKGATFENANLLRATFTNTNLQGASFNTALLQDVSFTAVDLEGASLVKAKLQGADFNEVAFDLSDWRGVNWDRIPDEIALRDLPRDLSLAYAIQRQKQILPQTRVTFSGTPRLSHDGLGPLIDHPSANPAEFLPTRLHFLGTLLNELQEEFPKITFSALHGELAAIQAEQTILSSHPRISEIVTQPSPPDESTKT